MTSLIDSVHTSSTTSTTVSSSSTTKNNEQIEAGVWILTYETDIIEEKVTRTDKGTLSFTINQNGDLVGIGTSHYTYLYNDTELEWIVTGEVNYTFEIFGYYFPDSGNVTTGYSLTHNPETYKETSIYRGETTITNTKLIGVPILHPNININLKSGTTQVYHDGVIDCVVVICLIL